MKTGKPQCKAWLAALALLPALAALPPGAAAEGVYRLDVNERGKTRAQGLATLLSGDTLLTSASLVGEGDQFVVSVPAEGLGQPREILAEVVASDEASDLALLRIPGLGGEPVSLAMDGAQKDRKVILLLPDSEREGTVVSIDKSPEAPPVISHNIELQADEQAAPLMNNCGELLGISLSQKRRVRDRLLRREASPFGKAGDLGALRAFILSHGVAYQRAATRCLSGEEQLKQERAQRELAQQLLEEENRRRQQEVAGKQNEIAAIRDERDRAREDEELTRAELEEQTRTAAERQRAQRQRSFWTGLGLTAALVAAIGGGVFAFILFRRRRQDQALAKAQDAFPNLLLAGTDADGKEHRLKISGNALMRSEEGLMIGRSAQQADYILDLDYVSRRHCLLLVRNGRVYVRDLGSANGTAVNGQDLAPHQEAHLGDGAELRLGLLTLNAIVGG